MIPAEVEMLPLNTWLGTSLCVLWHRTLQKLLLHLGHLYLTKLQCFSRSFAAQEAQNCLGENFVALGVGNERVFAMCLDSDQEQAENA